MVDEGEDALLSLLAHSVRLAIAERLHQSHVGESVSHGDLGGRVQPPRELVRQRIDAHVGRDREEAGAVGEGDAHGAATSSAATSDSGNAPATGATPADGVVRESHGSDLHAPFGLGTGT